MGNKLNPFEEQLKKAANNFEAPYDASAWANLENRLDQSGSSGFSSVTKWVSAAVIVIAVGVGGYFVNQSSSTKVEQKELSELAKSESESSELPKKESKNTPIDVEEKESESIAVPNAPKKEAIVSLKPESVKENETEIDIEPKLKHISPEEQKSSSETNDAIAHESEKKPIPVLDSEILEINTEKVSVCAGVEIEFNQKGMSSTSLVWMVDDNDIMESHTMTYKFRDEGKYIVKAANIETGVISNELEITVKPQPDASFRIKESKEMGIVPVVYFAAISEGELNYKWNLGDGISGNGVQISHTYRRAKDYEISLQVVNKQGCYSTSYQPYTNKKEFNLLAPNSFSPTVADGVNDYWFPKALASGYYKFELSVYDRNNQLVFTSSDPQANWNGVVNGTMAKPSEFFVWKASVIDPNGIQQLYSGSILVL